MKLTLPAAVTKLAARLKQTLLGNTDKLQRLSAARANLQLGADLIAQRTPGAFGHSCIPHRYKGPGGGLWRRNAAHGKVRGY